jgi:hypothetical protein
MRRYPRKGKMVCSLWECASVLSSKQRPDSYDNSISAMQERFHD